MNDGTPTISPLYHTVSKIFKHKLGGRHIILTDRQISSLAKGRHAAAIPGGWVLRIRLLRIRLLRVRVLHVRIWRVRDAKLLRG